MTRLRDLKSSALPKVCVVPSSGTYSQSSATVDRAGTDAAMVSVFAGSITDGIFTPWTEHSTDGTTWAACSYGSGDLSAALTAVSNSAASMSLQTVNYVGSRRYIRCGFSVSGTPSTGGVVGAWVTLGEGRTLPLT